MSNITYKAGLWAIICFFLGALLECAAAGDSAGPGTIGNRSDSAASGTHIVAAEAANSQTSAVTLSLKDQISILDFGARADGRTDDSDSINAAIAYASGVGKKVLLPAGKTIAVGTSVMLRSRVTLEGQGGTILRWTGPAGGSVVTTSTREVIYNCGLSSVEIDAGQAGFVIDVHSAFGCKFQDIVVDSKSKTSTILNLTADSTEGEYPVGTRKRNIANNIFSNITSMGICGTFLSLSGTGERRKAPQVVTLNTFNHLFARECYHRGIHFRRFSDSNTFGGITRVLIEGDNSIGVEFGESPEARAEGVYADTFEHLAVASRGKARGRIGIRLNAVQQISIQHYFNDPPAEEGVIVVSPWTRSYSVNYADLKGGQRMINYFRNKTAIENKSSKFRTGSQPVPEK